MERSTATAILAALALAVMAAGGDTSTEKSPTKPDAAEASTATVKPAEVSEGTKKVSSPPPESRLRYRPPRVGKPARSVGGGSRGTHEKVPALYALVPDHVGQTTSSQPSLFWFIDRRPGSQARLEFTLLGEDDIDPRVEATLDPPTKAGVQRIRLDQYGIELDPGVEYEWSVSLVLDRDDPSKDIVATGWIDRVDRPTAKARAQAAGADGAAFVYADEGLWYDALSDIEDRIDRSPEDAGLRQMQASLFEQVGLGVAARAVAN